MSAANTGGPAFPEPGLSGLPNAEFIYGREGMTLRDYYVAHAPANEIALLIPVTRAELVKWLGIESYNVSVHLPMSLAKARGIWADAMIAERASA